MGWFDQQAQQMPQQGGSLAALGGGTGRNAPIYNPVQPPQSGPQPVPGMPPRPMRDLILPGGGGGFWNPPPNIGVQVDNGNGGPMTQQDYDNTVKRYNELLPESQKYFRDFGPPDPNDPTRNEMNILAGRMLAWQAMPGNAPVLQPMGNSEGPGGFTGHAQDPNFGQLGTIGAGPYGNRGSGQPLNQPMGSLQGLGGGMNQSGMVNLRGPDGSTKAVPQSDLAHWLSRGAQQIQGAF
jgi:hypothetical protein